jgi:hypothetical protein
VGIPVPYSTLEKVVSEPGRVILSLNRMLPGGGIWCLLAA